MLANKLSVKSTCDISVLNGENIKLLHGTYSPHCAKIRLIPSALNKLLLPEEFKPYNNIPKLSSSRLMSFGIYSVSSIIIYIIGCLIAIACTDGDLFLSK